jgi:4-aminobutyrate aminotransferase-like enzyme
METILQNANHPTDVRAAGLYIGVEFSQPDSARTPAPGVARALINSMRNQGVLISAAGPGANVLKIRPPLVFSNADTDRFLEAFDIAVRETAA